MKTYDREKSIIRTLYVHVVLCVRFFNKFHMILFLMLGNFYLSSLVTYHFYCVFGNSVW